MRKGELDCVHSVGHSANNHGCDGCCFVLGVYERERIIKLLEDPANHRNDVDPDWYTGIADAIALIKGESK